MSESSMKTLKGLLESGYISFFKRGVVVDDCLGYADSSIVDALEGKFGREFAQEMYDDLRTLTFVDLFDAGPK